MNINEINATLAALNAASEELENLYLENGGEETEDTAALADQINAVKDLLEGGAIDSLGRWLKGKEDEAAALKAEKAHIARRQKYVENSIAFIKEKIFQVLEALGKEQVKGISYAFKTYHSRTVEADKTILKERYQEQALEAIHAAGIPLCVGVSLTASSSLVEGELPDFFTVTESDTVKFSKPRVTKNE